LRHLNSQIGGIRFAIRPYEIAYTLIVLAGLVPAISIRMAQRFPDRDRRDKPGDDASGRVLGLPSLIAAACEEPGDRNILVKAIPMQTKARERGLLAFLNVALRSRGNHASGTLIMRPSVRSTHIACSSKRTAVGEGEVVMPGS
jgi:hypothetical protein